MAKIAIIGAGFSGMGAAFFLQKQKQDHEITIFEHSQGAGGLASGFKMPEWNWNIEHFIHHWFSTDTTAFGVAREIGLGDKLILKETRSSCFYKGKIARLDSPISVLKFPFMGLLDRIRMGLVTAWLKLDKNYLKYENMTSYNFIRKYMGKSAFEVIWKPLFEGKFGKYANEINAAWFWARIHARTKKLGYIEGGFQKYVETLVSYLQERKVKIKFNAGIDKIAKKKDKFEIKIKKKIETFDIVVFTTPLSIALRLFDFPKEYSQRYSQLQAIGAQSFMLELNHKFLKDDTYWLNVNDSGFPFMMVAEHTNFVDRKNYNGKHMVWVGKYLDYDSPLWNMREKELLSHIEPYLKKINPNFEHSWIKRSFFHRAKNAQPISKI